MHQLRDEWRELSDRRPRLVRSLLIGFAVIVALFLICLLIFVLAERVVGWLGITGNIVLSRLLGVMLAALAVQFMIDGVRAVMTG